MAKTVDKVRLQDSCCISNRNHGMQGKLHATDAAHVNLFGDWLICLPIKPRSLEIEFRALQVVNAYIDACQLVRN